MHAGETLDASSVLPASFVCWDFVLMALNENPVQDGRLLRLSTPLGNDVLIPKGLIGSEHLSDLFSFRIEAVSKRAAVEASSLLGKSVTLSIWSSGSKTRYLNGIVTAFAMRDAVVNGFRNYELVVSPKLWLLTCMSDCRIFQNMSVVQIAEKIFSENEITAYKTMGLTGAHTARDYCVQYNETHYDFVRRILTEEGIYFYFEFEDGKHTLILSDSTSGYSETGEQGAHAPAQAGRFINISALSRRDQIISGKVTLRDYSPKQPTADMSSAVTTKVSQANIKSYELFRYPGRFVSKSIGEKLAKVGIEAEEAQYEQADGLSNYATFFPGGRFTVADHEASSEQGKKYAIISVTHEGVDLSRLGNSNAPPPSYNNSFRALPAATPYRLSPIPSKPTVPGLQTALVVGPKGDEVYADKLGRIKVQFHWDRLGKNDENSSCWIRVAQMQAGPGWGTQFMPRVGMEAVVSFLDGDPDRPLVIGTVPNANRQPIYLNEAMKTQSGIKTRSTTDGTASMYNELRFDDKKGSEEIYVYAQKDLNAEIKNNETRTVENDQTLTVKKNRAATISEGNESLTVSKGTYVLNVDTSDATTNIKKGNITQNVSAGNKSLNVTKGNYTVTMTEGSEKHTLTKGNFNVALTSGSAGISSDSGSITLKTAGGSVTVEAAQSITLKVGSNSIVISQSGITMKGVQVMMSADGTFTAKGSVLNLEGSGPVTVNGAIVKIN